MMYFTCLTGLDYDSDLRALTCGYKVVVHSAAMLTAATSRRYRFCIIVGLKVGGVAAIIRARGAA